MSCLRLSDIRHPTSDILRCSAIGRLFPFRTSYFVLCTSCAFLFSLPALAGGLGAGGDLYVGSTSPDKVVQFDGQTGALVGDFVATGMSEPVGLTFGPNGNLFVNSAVGNSVIEVDGATGAQIGTFASGGGLDGPTGLVFGPNGNLFVCSLWTDSVIEFDGTTGAPIGTFASGGALHRPIGLVFAPNGNLLVSGKGSDNVIEYDGSTGALVGTFASGGALRAPHGLGFGPNGNLFVVSRDTNVVVEFERTTGALLGTFASGGLSRAYGLAFGPTNGNLYVASPDSDQVIEYDGVTGVLVGTFASGVNAPRSLAFKPFGGPFPPPDVTGFAPVAANGCGMLLDAVIGGTGLAPGAAPTLVRAGEPDIPGFVTGFAGDTQITANFYLGGVAAGIWDLVVTYPDGQSDTLAAALQVLACPPLTLAGVDPSTAEITSMPTLLLIVSVRLRFARKSMNWPPSSWNGFAKTSMVVGPSPTSSRNHFLSGLRVVSVTLR